MFGSLISENIAYKRSPACLTPFFLVNHPLLPVKAQRTDVVVEKLFWRHEDTRVSFVADVRYNLAGFVIFVDIDGAFVPGENER
jgi:hypothetical protein